MALAAVPAGLLIAVTAHLSTDVAAAPLLWVIPLALYLLTFVIVFQTRPLLPHAWMVKIQPLFIAALVVLLAFEVLHYIFLTTAGNIAAFFVTALVCHGELARRRPAPPSPDRVLHVDVGGRHDRRHRGRPDRAARLLLGRRISAADRARHPVPARA